MSKIYEFVYRGVLADQALDATGRRNRPAAAIDLEEITQALSLDLYDLEYLLPAQQMSVVYTAIAAFENSVRRFIYKVLIDKFGEEWWEKGVSKSIQEFVEKRRDDEEKTKWHGARGDDQLSYTELGHLPKIMQQNWELFEPYVRRIDWATSIFSTLERSRNVIMHGGVLAMPDIERVGMSTRDWNAQVSL
jgi:hypothetical protein